MSLVNTDLFSNGNGNNREKAQGFINVYLPTADGGRRQIGYIALYQSKSDGAQLLNALNADPEKLADLQAKMVMEYRSVTDEKVALAI